MKVSLLLMIGAGLSMAAASSAGFSFTGLSHLPGGSSSQAFAVSADGTTVAGYSNTGDGHEEAFRWTASGGMTGIGILSGYPHSKATGLSADGSTLVGSGYSPSMSAGPPDEEEAFRWTVSGGMEGLGHLPQSTVGSYATGVSADGSIVIGNCDELTSGNEAFMWTASDGMAGLGDLPGGGAVYSHAFGISADGSTVAGFGSSDNGLEAYRWTESGGMVGLGFPAGDYDQSEAFGISADGSTIIGRTSFPGGYEPFIWKESEGMVGLGHLPNRPPVSSANGVSGDGSTVVGTSAGEAFVWDEINGMRSLQAVLEDGGVDMTGWLLGSAEDVSDDGKTITGFGLNPDGETEAFVAVIPEPSTVSLLGLGAAAGVLLKRRNKQVALKNPPPNETLEENW